ncbi:hypothetical protein SKA58_12080 [Sphingomonas sp. SKA58]|nr:hypothetical protein SKA58_12080 [Sphingomonas sp. SKA58]
MGAGKIERIASLSARFWRNAESAPTGV